MEAIVQSLLAKGSNGKFELTRFVIEDNAQ